MQNKRYLKYTIIIFFTFSSLFSLASEDSTLLKYKVDPAALNIRNNPSTNSNIIGKLKKNDTVEGVPENKKWIKISFENKNGYIFSKHTTKIRKPGFVTGFTNGFGSVFIYVLFGMAAIIYYKSKRVKDGRFKGGYRELPFSTIELIKIALYSTILSSIIGLISGVISWINSF